MADDHDHGVGHDHAAPPNPGRAFAMGIALNLTIVVVEAVFGFVSHSMALLADAGHNLSDVLGPRAVVGRGRAGRAQAHGARNRSRVERG